MKKSERTRIGIVGVTPKKQALLKQEFGTLARLTFWSQGSTAALQSLGRSNDVVLVGRMSGHNCSEVLNTVRAQWRYIPSFSDMRSALAAYAGVQSHAINCK